MYLYKPVIHYQRCVISDLKQFNNPRDIIEVAKREILSPKESFLVFYLSVQNTMLEKMMMHKLSVGTVDQCPVFVREIAYHALILHSSRVIVAHNHPSGNVNPSSADKGITEKIKSGLAVLDVELLDHLIVSEDSYFSFQENSLI